jgi:Phosphotransferase enzyme family
MAPVTDGHPLNNPSTVPVDAALPGSVLLQQPEQLVAVLSLLLAEWLGGDAQLMASRVAVRRYVPGRRCLVDLELVIHRDGVASAEGRSVVGKLYAGDEAARVYETLTQLWARGFGTGPYTVPQPLAYDPAWRLLLLSRASGRVLRELLLDAVNVSAAVDRAVAWLVKLHTCGLSGGRRYSFDRHLHTLGLWQGRLSDVYPDALQPFGSVLAQVARRGRDVAGWEPAPTHRDFSPDHLVIDEARVCGLDFDEFCQYDPLFDVAHFVAHLQFLGLTFYGALHRFDALATRFQAAYEARAREYSIERIRLYQAIAYLKLAYITACVTRPSDRAQVVATLLREAQRIV